jgi:hypothetical protein
MHKVAIIILTSCILVIGGCTYGVKKDSCDYSAQKGRYVLIHRKAPNPQAKGVIKGVVSDSSSGKCIPYANILLLGTTIGTVTNLQGYYEIEVYYPKKYKVMARMVRYSNIITEPIEVETGSIIILNFEMEEDTTRTPGVEVFRPQIKINPSPRLPELKMEK